MHTGIRLQKHFTDNEKTVEDSKRQTAVTNRQIFGLQIFFFGSHMAEIYIFCSILPVCDVIRFVSNRNSVSSIMFFLYDQLAKAYITAPQHLNIDLMAVATVHTCICSSTE